jgi:arylsulfatase A-like enzyme
MRDRLRSAIAAWSGQPTFWFVNLCECHSPYLPPRPWNDLPPLERVRAALEAQRHLTFEAICLYAAGHWEISEEAFSRMRHLYCRAAGYMDQWLADVLEALRARDILDNTLVIVTSDHGENFGEAGLIAHGFSVDQRLIHVPLVISGPGAGEITEPFSLADMPRFIANAVGLEDHPWRSLELPDGVVVAQFDPLAASSHPRIRDWAARWQLDDDAVRQVTAAHTCATDGKRKLVARDGVEVLYDLQADPTETTPLDPADANGELAALRAGLERACTTETVTVPSPGPPPAASPQELEAIERQMKLLGYM